MTNEEYLELKEEYYKLINLRNKQFKINKRLQELKQNEAVIEYINLVKDSKVVFSDQTFNMLDKTTNDIAYEAACNCSITPTTNIYVYIRTIKNGENVEDFANGMDYALFGNIEDMSEIYTKVTEDELEDFVTNNIIINGKWKSGIVPSEFFHELIQQEYFQNVVEYGQTVTNQIFKGYSKREASIKKLLSNKIKGNK